MFCLSFHTLFIIFGLFLFSAIFVFQVFRSLKVPNKSRKNYIKNQRPVSFPKNQRWKGVDLLGPQEGPWCGPTLGRARRPPGCPVAPLGAPFGPCLAPAMETPKIDLLFPFSSLYHRR